MVQESWTIRQFVADASDADRELVLTWVAAMERFWADAPAVVRTKAALARQGGDDA